MDLLASYDSDEDSVHAVQTKADSSDGHNNDARKEKSAQIAIRTSDDVESDLFERSFGHRRGHWSSCVFIPIKQMPHDIAGKCASRVKQVLEERGISGTLVLSEDLHISLSRQVSLQSYSLGSFEACLGQTVESFRQFPTIVDITRILLLVNDEQTRSFFAWPVIQSPFLMHLIQRVNHLLKTTYDMPSYYERPILHVSFASMPLSLVSLLQDWECLSGFAERHVETATCIAFKFGSTTQRDIELSK